MLLLSFGSAIPNQLHWTSSKAFKAFCLFIANLDHNFPWLSVCRCSASGMYLNEVNKELFPTQGTCYLEIKKISKSCLVPSSYTRTFNWSSSHILIFMIHFSRHVKTWYDDWSLLYDMTVQKYCLFMRGGIFIARDVFDSFPHFYLANWISLYPSAL